MEYKGKLYGKVHKSYFPLEATTDEWDAMVKRISQLEAENQALRQPPVISRFSIPEILELIEEQTGLKLELCDHFTGIKEHNGRRYFNVILSQITSESKDYDTLKRFADKYKMISVEPNGLKRVAIFQNGL